MAQSRNVKNLTKLLFLIVLLTIVYARYFVFGASYYGEWTVSNDWTVSSEWTIGGGEEPPPPPPPPDIFATQALSDYNDTLAASGLPYILGGTATLIRLHYANNRLYFTVSAASGLSSTTTVNATTKGYPTTVTGATIWSYSGTTITVRIDHSSEQEVIIYWDPGTPSGDGSAGYSPHKIDTKIIVVTSNFTVQANNLSLIEGYLKTVSDDSVVGTISFIPSWEFSNYTVTKPDGYFLINFPTPKLGGEYPIKLVYNGDPTYNPSVFGTTLTVVGEAEPVGFQISIPLLFIGVFILIIVAVAVFANWWENQKW